MNDPIRFPRSNEVLAKHNEELSLKVTYLREVIKLTTDTLVEAGMIKAANRLYQVLLKD